MKRMIVVLLLCGMAVAVDKKPEPLLVPAVITRAIVVWNKDYCNSHPSDCVEEYEWSCEDRSRILLQAEDGKRWCLRTKGKADGR